MPDSATDLTPPSLETIARRNIRHFLIFRVLFNARFYYPVFAVIFLDFGLTLEQFAMLNAIWAATILLAEVPSGSLSDLMGRKSMMVFTASLMVIEMAVWAWAPTGNPNLLFWVLAANRILSGLGEAAASGSDEALVYDSLEAANMQDRWSHVLESVSRWQSIGFMVTMILGALVYDADLMQDLLKLMGFNLVVTSEHTLRIPLFLTFGTALLCWFNNLRFVDVNAPDRHTGISIWDATRQTLSAGQWILQTPFALIIILAGAFADSILRMFATLGSEYYRLVQYPEFTFGVIGAGIAILNFMAAPWIRRLVDHFSPSIIFACIVGLSILGFAGASFAIPWLGLGFAIILFLCFSLVSFSISFYLNQVSNRKIRATVLSFKGMALNLAYGCIGLAYAQLTRHLNEMNSATPDSPDVFQQGLAYFTPYVLVGSLVVAAITWLHCRDVNSIALGLKQQSKGQKSESKAES